MLYRKFTLIMAVVAALFATSAFGGVWGNPNMPPGIGIQTMSVGPMLVGKTYTRGEANFVDKTAFTGTYYSEVARNRMYSKAGFQTTPKLSVDAGSNLVSITNAFCGHSPFHPQCRLTQLPVSYIPCILGVDPGCEPAPVSPPPKPPACPPGVPWWYGCWVWE